MQGSSPEIDAFVTWRRNTCKLRTNISDNARYTMIIGTSRFFDTWKENLAKKCLQQT